MKTLKNIFVTYEIAQKLKEIGFDEPCIAVYNPMKKIEIGFYELLIRTNFVSEEELIIQNFNELNDEHYCSAPTWEQVFKWFVEKDFSYSLGIGKNRVLVVVLHLDEVLFSESVMGDNRTQKARELLIDEMIKVYTKNVPQ